ncbi:MAG: alpha-L-fucosidase [Bacteroidetes bacterium]|nr:alpha-L-fucosidase [Bacteroidota bacterium]
MQDPILINPTSINQLLALDAAHNLGLKEFNPGSTLNAKRFWLTDLVNGNKMEWAVFNRQKAGYLISVLLKAKAGTQLKIEAGSHSVVMEAKDDNWQRATAKALLSLPAGKTIISLELINTSSPVDIKSIELVNAAEKQDIEKRVAASKGDCTWMKDAGYGIMVQGGGWSYPPHGDKKPWPGFAQDFDAKKFVEKVYEMGGSYILWSATWIDYLFPAPIKAIGDILPNRISKRDLIAALISECKKKNIRFMLYYHLGHGSKEVLLAKGWKDSSDQDYASRQKWLKTEEAILTEIGNRYGTGLDGIFLDDGCVWYPADFEKLGKAVKAGNPKRVIAYNPWIAPSLTPFQDFYCGEGFDGSTTPYKLNNGIIMEGPQKGLQLFGCFVFDGPDWGIYKPNTIIDTPKNWSVDRIVDLTHKLVQQHYTIAFNLLMYEDGSFGEQSFKLLKQAAMKLKRGEWKNKEGN